MPIRCFLPIKGKENGLLIAPTNVMAVEAKAC